MLQTPNDNIKIHVALLTTNNLSLDPQSCSANCHVHTPTIWKSK